MKEGDRYEEGVPELNNLLYQSSIGGVIIKKCYGMPVRRHGGLSNSTAGMLLHK